MSDAYDGVALEQGQDSYEQAQGGEGVVLRSRFWLGAALRPELHRRFA